MIILVNRFEVTGATDEFERVFERTSAFFAAQPGFLRHRLLRRTDDPARYVNIAEWEDEPSLRRALARQEFGARRSALRAVSSSDPALYSPLLERTPS